MNSLIFCLQGYNQQREVETSHSMLVIMKNSLIVYREWPLQWSFILVTNMFSSNGVNQHQSHAVDKFFNLRFFLAYLVHIDSPNRGHEYIVSTPKYTIKAFILEMIAKNILLNVSISQCNNNKIKKYCQYYFVTWKCCRGDIETSPSIFSFTNNVSATYLYWRFSMWYRAWKIWDFLILPEQIIYLHL